MNSKEKRSQEPEFRSQNVISGWCLRGRGLIHRTRNNVGARCIVPI
ncbi:hypothetical protein KJ898_04395 [bacterium]|nr:hypothetical protein [bacterium]